MAVRILCAADIHLGRRPAQLPAGMAAGDFSPAAAWQRFVDSAVERHVDAVVLTGDVVDESNKLFEAFSALHRGIERLEAADIPVFAVSGNHDFDVLPRLAWQIPGFHLLGRGGRWEHVDLERQGTPAVRFLGWSFPARHVADNPLADFPTARDGPPTVCLLHCDCDTPSSAYGPVALAALKGKGPTAWILGHIHRPALLCPALPLVLYPGSLQGLDAAEQGTRGAWLVTLETGQTPRAEQLPMAGLRWEQIDLLLDGAADEAAVEQIALQALRQRHQEIRGELAHAKAVGCRLRLLGRTAAHSHVPGLMARMQAELRPAFEDVEYFVEQVEDLSRPDLCLENLARANDPAGLLARRLLLLEARQPAEAYGELLRRAKTAMSRQRLATAFAPLPDSAEQPDDEQIHSLLSRAGLMLLDRLMAQKEAGA